jgi:cobalt-zinc-cadmium efflux system protein
MSHHSTYYHGKIKHGKAFAIGILLNVVFVGVEVFYGLLAGSSALLADAGHNASDVLSLLFAWGAAWLATKKPTGKYTYGLRRTTILVSILNALLLFGAVGFIAWDAIQKLLDPQPVAGGTVMLVAGIGMVINTATALLFFKGQKEDLNIKGAFLHMAADAAVSLGVLVAGFAILQTGYYIIDPVLTFIIIIVIVWSTWRLFIDSINLALDAVPKDIDLQKVEAFLERQPGVEEVHDLHVWAMSTTQTALTAHVVMPEGNSDEFIFQIREKLQDRFGINHTTIQVEKTFKDHRYRGDCGDC